MTEVGKPITRAEALQISQQILESAEQERIEAGQMDDTPETREQLRRVIVNGSPEVAFFTNRIKEMSAREDELEAEVARLQAEVAAMRKVLEGYEALEAAVIMDTRCWTINEPDDSPAPIVYGPHYDRAMELQAERNKILHEKVATGKPYTAGQYKTARGIGLWEPGDAFAGDDATRKDYWQERAEKAEAEIEDIKRALKGKVAANLPPNLIVKKLR